MPAEAPILGIRSPGKLAPSSMPLAERTGDPARGQERGVLADAKEFSMQGSGDGFSVPCKSPPCRGCKPCTSCSPCRGAENTDVPTAKAPPNSR